MTAIIQFTPLYGTDADSPCCYLLKIDDYQVNTAQSTHTHTYTHIHTHTHAYIHIHIHTHRNTTCSSTHTRIRVRQRCAHATCRHVCVVYHVLMLRAQLLTSRCIAACIDAAFAACVCCASACPLMHTHVCSSYAYSIMCM